MQNSSYKRGFRQRFIAWIACASVLLSVIAPTVSHALASQSTPSGMMKVCTSTGNKFIPVSFIIAKANVNVNELIPVTSPRNNKADKISGCSGCDQHASSTILMHYANHLLIETSSGARRFSAFYINPRSQYLGSSSSPRGPPLAA
jgi:hypothetical protein